MIAPIAGQGESVYEHCIYEVAGGVATITIDRPDRLNALSPTALAEMAHALETADAVVSPRT